VNVFDELRLVQLQQDVDELKFMVGILLAAMFRHDDKLLQEPEAIMDLMEHFTNEVIVRGRERGNSRPLVQQMIKSDALIAALGQVRDDLRKQANQIDAVINMASKLDEVTGMADALQGGVAASKGRLINLMKKMYPELATPAMKRLSNE
jgi:hypothetical protein